MKHDEHKNLSRAQVGLENCMIVPKIFKEICKEAGFIPYIDMRTDRPGSQSCAVFKYSAYEDSTKQAKNQAGHDI